MAWPTFTVADLATNSGRPQASYTGYANQAIAEALLLFKIYTCLKDWPSNTDDDQLAQYAVLSMADAFITSQPYALTMGSPFSSESIGSYSYSKAMKKLQAGLPTGLTWFDLAISQLGVCESGPNGGIAHGSMEVFERDGYFHTDSTGKKRVLGPKDIEPISLPFVVRDPSQEPL